MESIKIDLFGLNIKIERNDDGTFVIPDILKQQEGNNVSLKPSLEFWTLVRKPLSEPTIAKNVLKHTTGALNIDISRIPTTDKLDGGHTSGSVNKNDGGDRPWKSDKEAVEAMAERSKLQVQKSEQLGRFPANLIIDGSEEVVELFPNNKSHKEPSDNYAVNDTSRDNCFQLSKHKHHFNYGEEATTSASRFFYTAKASKSEKNLGLPEGVKNIHPSVKPISLCKFLVNLIAPPGGIVYDPFTGSGSILVAAIQNGFKFLGSELDESYCEIANYRIKYALEQTEKT
jgi:site-specific DNA-methyltransferase (adenine-specific)